MAHVRTGAVQQGIKSSGSGSPEKGSPSRGASNKSLVSSSSASSKGSASPTNQALKEKLESKFAALESNASELTRESIKAFENTANHVRDTITKGHFHKSLEKLVLDIEKDLHRPRIIDQYWFTTIVTCAICVNAVIMGIETDYPEHKSTYHIFELIFTIIFTFEMGAKLWYLRKQYFKDGWNVLDFVLVWMSIIDGIIMDMILGGGGNMKSFSALRILRVMRIVKMVRLLKAFRELWLIVQGMLNSVKTIFWATVLQIMLLYVCGIFCCQMIGQNTSLGYFRGIDEVTPGTEIDYHPDFDSYQFYGTIPRAMFTLFETCIEPLNIRPVVEKQPHLFFFYLGYMFITTFGLMNVIIGVIVDNTMNAGKDQSQDEAALEMMRKLKKMEMMENMVFEFGDQDKDGSVTFDEIYQGIEDPEIARQIDGLPLPVGCTMQEFFDLVDSDCTELIEPGELLKNLLRMWCAEEKEMVVELKLVMHQLKRNMIDGLSEVNHDCTDVNRAVNALQHEVRHDVQGRLEKIEQRIMQAAKQLGGNTGALSALKLPSEGDASHLALPETFTRPLTDGESLTSLQSTQGPINASDPRFAAQVLQADDLSLHNGGRSCGTPSIRSGAASQKDWGPACSISSRESHRVPATTPPVIARLLAASLPTNDFGDTRTTLSEMF